eukprot:TRINITY_DN25432_c0_g1_i3.p1 TRINITY_DN25432_c0_g1~~TRINITY_DN25432_c0_g1_i3.p1  ORF type:complete len:696 (+),score=85.93 TRINITY_DN25432_c0_g1_i3:167-2254(+)
MADVCDNIARQALNKCVHLERILVRSKDQFLSDTECQSFGWGDWCVGTPSLLRYCSNYDCPILSKSHQSLIGLLGMVRNSGEVFPVASGVLYVAFALIFLAWVCLVGKVAFGVSQRLGHYVKAGFRDAGGPSRWLKGCKDYLDPLHDLSEDGRKHVREMVRSRTLRRFSSAAMAVSLVLPMVMLAGTEDGDPRNAAICKPHVQGSSCFQEQVYRHQRLASQTVGTTLLVGCCLVASLLPHIVCGKYVVFTHSALYIGIAWHLLDMVALPEFVELQQGFLVYVRIAAAVVHGDVFVVAVLNFSLAFLQQFARQYGYPPDMYTTEFKAGFDRTSRECFLHAIIIVFVTAVVEYSRIDLVKQALHAQESVAESTTVHGMLNLMCDAVAVLYDSSIASPCPKLAALLFRSQPDCLQARKLQDLVHPEDRDRLSGALSNTSQQCLSLHIRLLDAFGSAVPVQLFVALKLGFQQQHIVGIREDTAPGEQRIADLAELDAVETQRQATVIGMPLEDSESDAMSSVSRQGRNKGPQSLCSLPENSVVASHEQQDCRVVATTAGMPDLPIAWIALDGTWELKKATHGCVALLGQALFQGDRDVRNWFVANDKKEDFCAFVQNVLLSPTQNVGAILRNTKLLTPGMPTTTIRCHFLYLFTDPGDDDESGCRTIGLLLADIRYKQKDSGKAKTHRSPGPSLLNPTP